MSLVDDSWFRGYTKQYNILRSITIHEVTIPFWTNQPFFMGSPIGVHLLVILSPFCPVYPVTTPINIYIYIYWNDIIYTYINININILHTHLFASYPHFPWYHIKNPHLTSVVITAHFWMRISLTEHRGYESKLRSLFIGTLQIVGLLPQSYVYSPKYIGTIPNYSIKYVWLIPQSYGYNLGFCGVSDVNLVNLANLDAQMYSVQKPRPWIRGVNGWCDGISVGFKNKSPLASPSFGISHGLSWYLRQFGYHIGIKKRGS